MRRKNSSSGDISVLIVNYNSSRFVELSLLALSHLSEEPPSILIMDNGSKKSDQRRLSKVCSPYPDVHLFWNDTKLRGSLAHATALNALVEKVDTQYFSVLDADATWLMKGWDSHLKSMMKGNIKVVGSQAPGSKPKDFPYMFAALYETEAFRKAEGDFMPSDDRSKGDTGYLIRERFRNNGFDGIVLPIKLSREQELEQFEGIVCGTFHDPRTDELLAAHFGRGSTIGLAKYFRDSKSPLAYLRARNQGLRERDEWILRCINIILQEGTTRPDFETLTACLHCGSGKLRYEMAVKDWLAKTPGPYHVMSCSGCGLVFQNPRVEADKIGPYYKGMGYFEVPKEESRLRRFLLWKTLRHHFGYAHLSTFNPVWWMLTLPLRRRTAIGLFPKYEEGRVLDIGCSNGELLSKLRDAGWEVEGIEFHGPAAKYAQNKRKMKIHLGAVEDVKIPPFTYDAITMGMVLEHLARPFQSLEDISGWLKPGGELIIAVPTSGLEFRIFRQYSYLIQQPTHYIIPSKKILEDRLQRLGFENIRFYYHAWDRDIVGSLHYYCSERGHTWILRIIRNKIVRNILVRPIVVVMSRLGLTSRFTVSAVKKKIP